MGLPLFGTYLNFDSPTEYFKPSLVSHRNGHNSHPENSLQFHSLNKSEYALILQEVFWRAPHLFFRPEPDFH